MGYKSIIGGLVVLGAILLLVLSKGGEPAGDDNDHKTAEPAQSASVDNLDEQRARPSLPGKAPALKARRMSATNSGIPTKEYLTESGKVVRDHRKKDHPEITGELKKPRMPFKISAPTIARVRNELRPMVKHCSSTHPEALVGETPWIQGDLIVSVKDSHLVVDEVKIQHRDVDGDELIRCLEDGFGGLSFAVEGENEVDSHRLTMPFNL